MTRLQTSFKYIILALALMSSIACGSARNSMDQNPMGSWEVLELKINDRATPALESDEKIVFTFEQQEEGGSYGVRALVNAYGGAFKWGKGNIEILPGLGTLVVQTAYEDAFFDVFYGNGTYTVNEDQLTMIMKNGMIKAKKVVE